MFYQIDTVARTRTPFETKGKHANKKTQIDAEKSTRLLGFPLRCSIGFGEDTHALIIDERKNTITKTKTPKTQKLQGH